MRKGDKGREEGRMIGRGEAWRDVDGGGRRKTRAALRRMESLEIVSGYRTFHTNHEKFLLDSTKVICVLMSMHPLWGLGKVFGKL